MIKRLQRKANRWFGSGILIVGLSLVLSSMVTMDDVRTDSGGAGMLTARGGFLFLAWLLGLIGSAVFLWGCVNYVMAKGYSAWWGGLGLACGLGWLVMVLMPDRRKDGIDPDAPSFEAAPVAEPPPTYPAPPLGSNGAGPSED